MASPISAFGKDSAGRCYGFVTMSVIRR